jgi:diketogulonate reductase-like aldo/keto reductase
LCVCPVDSRHESCSRYVSQSLRCVTIPAHLGPGPVDEYLEALEKKYAVSAGEILLRWCIDQDIVPITTSSKEQRLSDMLRVATFKLTPKEVKEITDLGAKKNFRGFWKHIPGIDDME